MSGELQTRTEQREIARAVTPMQMLQHAMDQGADLDRLEKLMELQRLWEASEAKKAFHEAVAAFKLSPPQVVKDMTNSHYGNKYSSLANLVNTVNEAMSKHGLDASWEFEQTDKTISVTCILSHVMGYSKRATLSGPPDTSGSKNSIQQIKSTTTYLKGATFEAVTGIASREANADDDGNTSTAVERISEQQKSQLLDMINATETPMARFLKVAQVASLDDVRTTEFENLMEGLRNRQKRQQEAGK